MQIQQPNVATFGRADNRLLGQMSDNDDSIRNAIEDNAKGIVSLGLCNNMQVAATNYSGAFATYQRYTSSSWIDAQFTQPPASSLTVNFESNRYYKFTVHCDYVWTANEYVNASNGHTGRMEIRLRDMTHRHDLIYWTNLVDPDYNAGRYDSTLNAYYIRDINNNTNVNIWAWDKASADGCVPSSCHAVRVMAAKTSGAAVLKLQYRPMNAYGGIVPPELMDCSGGQPLLSLPIQYKNATTTYNTEAIKQFGAYVSVEDCGPTEKPAGAAAGVENDISVSPLFEAYENHAYDALYPERP
jgi:hypothetical protein